MERIPDDELIGAYLDDELSNEERARAERLLAERADLRRLLEELRAVRDGLRSLPSYHLEQDFGAAVLRRAEKEMLREHTSTAAGEPVPGAASSPPLSAMPSPVSSDASLTPASLAAPKPDGTPLGPSEPLARWRRPAAWSILAVAAALVIMFVLPRADDRRKTAVVMHDRANEAAPVMAPGEAARKLASDRDHAPAARSAGDGRKADRLGDARPDEAKNAEMKSAEPDFAAAKTKDAQLSDMATLPKQAPAGQGPVAGQTAAMVGQTGRPVGEVPATNQTAAKSALVPATSPDQSVPSVTMEAQIDGVVPDFQNRYKRQLAELDRVRCAELVDKLQLLEPTVAERERIAEPLQSRLAAEADPDQPSSDVLIVEVYFRPGAIESAFEPSLLRNRVVNVDADRRLNLAQTSVPAADSNAAGAFGAVVPPTQLGIVPPPPATNAPVTPYAPVTPNAPSAAVPAGPQGKSAPAPADDVARLGDEKIRQMADKGDAVQLRGTDGEEFYYVVADGPQLEGLLNELSADRRNFVSVRVEPAPRIETQQAWDQYSRRLPRPSAAGPSATPAPPPSAVANSGGASPAARPEMKPSLATKAGPAAIAGPAMKAGPAPMGDLGGGSGSAPGNDISQPTSLDRRAPASSMPAGSPAAKSNSAPMPGEAPVAVAAEQSKAVGQSKAAGKEVAKSEAASQAKPGLGPARPAPPMVTAAPAPAAPASAALSPPAIANMAAPAAGAVPPLAAPIPEAYGQTGIDVPQSRAQRFRRSDLSSVRGLERGRSLDPAAAEKPVDPSAERRMVENVAPRAEGLVRQEAGAPQAGAEVGGRAGDLRPVQPPAPSGPATPALTAKSPTATASTATVPASAAPTSTAPSLALPFATAAPRSAQASSTARTVSPAAPSPAPAAVAGAAPAAPSAAGMPSIPPRSSPSKPGAQVPANVAAAPSMSAPSTTVPPAEPGPTLPGAASQPALPPQVPIAGVEVGRPMVGLGGPATSYGAVGAQPADVYAGRQSVVDSLGRNRRQEALFIFRVAPQSEPGSAFGDQFDIAKERPAATAPATPAAAEPPSVPASPPPFKKGG